VFFSGKIFVNIAYSKRGNTHFFMQTLLYQLANNNWVEQNSNKPVDEKSINLVLCFAAKSILRKEGIYQTVRAKFPSAQIAFCSTAGEILQDAVLDNSFVAVAMHFDKTDIKSASVSIHDYENTYKASIALAKALPKEGLCYVLILSDGSLVNGSELVKGLSTQISKHILITGGLAGDGPNFQSTLAGINEQPSAGKIIAIGFYGSHLKVTHGSQSGWDIFGLEKTVTNSSGNILVELEHQNALDLYKKYLGKEADRLPGSALLFPLSVIIPGSDNPVVRTILSINEDDKTMTFAGDIPVGSKVRFMKADFERLTMAAAKAAGFTTAKEEKPGFSLLISCIGRKLVLGDKIAEEVKAVSNKYNGKTILAGFYSYGEISPFNEGGNCQLHNQTMTITSFYEN
jgi:hypothetical protein